MEVALALGESLSNISLHLLLERIIPENEGSTEIGLPCFEYWSEIQEQDVIVSDHQVWWVVGIRQQSISSCSHNSFVPVSSNPIHLFCQGVDVSVEGRLRDVRADQATCLDLVEQCLSLRLSFEKLRSTLLFDDIYSSLRVEE